jgi:hypothetical protein
MSKEKNEETKYNLYSDSIGNRRDSRQKGDNKILYINVLKTHKTK